MKDNTFFTIKLLGLILLVSVSIFSIPAVFSESIGSYELNQNVELYQTCNNCTYCNITSVKFRATTLLANQTMTKDGTYYSFFLDGGNTSEIGDYTYCYDCGNAQDKETGCIGFTINVAGEEISVGRSILYIGVWIISIFLFLLCLYGTIKIPFKYPRNSEGYIINVSDVRYLKIILFGLSYLILLWILWMGYSFSGLYLYSNTASLFFKWTFYLLLGFAFPTFILGTLFFFISFMEGKKIKKLLGRNLPIR